MPHFALACGDSSVFPWRSDWSGDVAVAGDATVGCNRFSPRFGFNGEAAKPPTPTSLLQQIRGSHVAADSWLFDLSGYSAQAESSPYINGMADVSSRSAVGGGARKLLAPERGFFSTETPRGPYRKSTHATATGFWELPTTADLWPRTRHQRHDHGTLIKDGKSDHLRATPTDTSTLRPTQKNGHSSLGSFFLGATAASFTSSSRSQEASELAAEALSEASIAEVNVRKAVEMAEDAAEDALAAAQVALWTEIIAAVATTAGLFASFVGFKMDDAELPEELKVPDEDGSLPTVLTRPSAVVSFASAPRASRGDWPAASSRDSRREPADADGVLHTRTVIR
eukprot:TRINITY_DN23043_c0_g1_i1.p1 TRINITY_DN23043_c0_g1~~TRINITY_DN23043_c0_g1_i1.p1  ORF type:complete len:340 (+),score=52.42 TRINITY_DN23043_c0_g1_i1:96-1115(+)